jgi:glyoxylase-like metal-dependent hydrolase (beta-lactamase superfamily II)
MSHIFLTHTDMDLASALDSDCKSDWLNNAEIFMGKEEVDLIEKQRWRRFIFYLPVEIKRRYNFVIDNDVIRIGNIEVKAIHTPGHMSYLINNAFLCTGDLLLLKDGINSPFYCIRNSNHELDKQSIKKIVLYENIEVLCTAHSKCSFDYQKALEDWK